MLRSMSLVCATIVLALCLAMAAPAVASVPMPAVSFSDAGVAHASGPDLMIGWRFSTTSPIRVSQLGFWDQLNADPDDGLNESHPVGIWATSGLGTSAAALVTATVSAGTGDPLAGGTRFRMHDVTPIILPAGDYVIGGLLQGTQAEPFKQTTDISGFAAAPGITYVEQRFANVNGFSRPESASTGLGAFGPNFAFVAVPEPSSIALATLGLAGLTARAFGRRKPSR